MEILFITSNENKLREARQILENVSLDSYPLDLEETQGSMETVIGRKLDEAYSKLNKPLMVEDTSLVFDVMGELPGPYIKDFLKNIPLDEFSLLASFNGEESRAKAVCMIGVMDDSGKKHIFKGECPGKIVKPRGESNFGWDPVFQPNAHEKTFAELTPQEKNEISHRKKALEKLRDFVQNSKTFK